jgi:hypothetical protein
MFCPVVAAANVLPCCCSGKSSSMDDEAHRLLQLLDACHDVLPQLGDRQDDVAKSIRETCEHIQARLGELGVAHKEAS